MGAEPQAVLALAPFGALGSVPVSKWSPKRGGMACWHSLRLFSSLSGWASACVSGPGQWSNGIEALPGRDSEGKHPRLLEVAFVDIADLVAYI